MNEMSERDSKETSFEGSSIKRMRLELDGDDSAVSRSQERTVSSSLAYSASDSEDEDHRSSSVSSGCSSSEIARDTGLPFLDLEAQQQISETEVSSLITINFRAQGSPSSEILGEMDSATTTTKTERRVGQKQEKKAKAPTQAELDDFFSAAERGQQKRFTDKYNYDIVNDTPLEGRYEWVSLKP
ncbi:cyclin-dependent kinase inhibitor 7 isoform X1 [Brassica napus]|uniref:cyclin-dependent kinase inhibitor 7 isoform X1 n=1 Tax=Brassica napus TaxID=3708 RepID=UPI0006AAF8EB|nr:cyclin-dependent kinase inhibitor 7 isoform X1 [Brassica napus]